MSNPLILPGAFSPEDSRHRQHMTNPPHRAEMLVLARDERGLTQADAATAFGISQGMLSKLESGYGSLSAELAEAMASTYGRPVEFFRYEGPIESPTFVLYRKSANVPPDIHKRFWSKITIAVIELKRLLTGAELTTAPLPFIDPDECRGGVAEVATRLRRMWKLPPGPVNNLIRTVENAGGIVLKMDFGTRKISGCSGFIDRHPVIFVNQDMSAVRQRLTIAHEAGHLIIHRYPSDKAEEQAFLFGMELLTPREEILPMLRPLSMDRFARLKMYWQVSIQALVKRAEGLGCIKASTARYYWAQLTARGYKESEPYDDQIRSEEPTLVPEILSTYLGVLKYSKEELARLMLVEPAELTNRYLGFSNQLRVVR